ncbi:MAG TPA: carbohydrate ABC transporter permease [Aggregatilinea sp.]|uniref:carbohydrate ABC transporter permease n=1 Tax=Aggregatilinea sp. TaxID=2806333 RepID=UPI002CAB8B63|nr:carbohydrate ABC transporter permease [Aggregatilinea sp.]HML24797.1 carbohydrate ABC transporter permease [Aggregatilinea sp.]
MIATRRVRPDKAAMWLLALPMGLIALSTIYPIFFTINIAAKTRKEYILDRFAISHTFYWENFSSAWEQSHMQDYFLNSVITTAGAVFLLLLVSSLAGYAFGCMRFKGRRLLFYLCLIGLMVPVQVILVPFYKLILDLHLLNKHAGLILSYTAFFLPFCTYLMTSFYAGIPREIIESAKLDGASLWMVYLRIILPMGKPALLSLGILNTLYCWNDVLISLLVMQERDKRTLMVGVTSLRGEFSTNVPQFAAGVILSVLPVIVVFLIFQRQIAKGITVGAVKG